MEPVKSVLETEVVVGRGLPEPMLVPREGRSRVAVLTQPAATTRAMEVAEALRSDGLITEVMGLPDRDQAKSLEVVASIYQAMASFGVGPHDLVVGVGGGSVTDVAGFVAATWLRGVEVAHFPTTLLGAIDASIGGKTAINVAGKNLVGVFWHPSRVVVDLDQLERLPSYLIREGLAEAFKAGLIGDAELARIVETNNSNLSEIVDRSITVKRTLVEQDPNDRGVRAYLNFGHTIGHAIEYSTPLSHGEAVSLGMVAACYISRDKVGFTESEDRKSVV